LLELFFTLVGCTCTTTYSYPRRMLSPFELTNESNILYELTIRRSSTLYIVIYFFTMSKNCPLGGLRVLSSPLRPLKTSTTTNILSIILCDFRGYSPAQYYHHILLNTLYFNFSGATPASGETVCLRRCCQLL
jgi:hypothetical protein